MESTSPSGLIIVPGDDAQRLTLIRVVENRFIEEEAERGLNVPSGTLYVPQQFGVIETPLGYIVVDHEGGHLKIPQEADETIKLLIWRKATSMPIGENPVSIRHILSAYCRHTMPVADFISNRDGMEVRWRALVTTLVSCGVNVAADSARREANLRENIITGGALPLDKTKLTT